MTFKCAQTSRVTHEVWCSVFSLVSVLLFFFLFCFWVLKITSYFKGSSRPSSAVTADTYASSDLEGRGQTGVFLKSTRKFMLQDNRDRIK